MSDYISREAVIAETRKPRLTDAELRRRLAELPAADVAPVVRCQHCRQGEESAEIQGLVYCNRFYRNMHPTEYCSFGERKTVDNGRYCPTTVRR